jgi:hypothetical protein
MSAASTAPPSGAPKIAPMPEPMPTDTAIRPSSADRSSVRASSEPKPAEICAVGPSRPPDPPDPMVTAEAISLTTTALLRIVLGLRCTASMAASVPWPSASGASQNTSTPETNPPAQVRTGISHQCANRALPGPPPSPTVPGGW